MGIEDIQQPGTNKPGSADYRAIRGVLPQRGLELLPTDNWHALHNAAKRQGNALPVDEKTKGLVGYILAIDPGETTGVAYGALNDGQLRSVVAYQFDTSVLTESFPFIWSLLSNVYTWMVVEDYRVYGHKTDSHAWEGLHTAKLIGAIQAIHQCFLFQMASRAQGDEQFETLEHAFVQPFKETMIKEKQITFRMAQQPKGFCTDDKLSAWGLNPTGLKHARDAVRHLTFQLLFGGSQKLNPLG